MNENTERLQVEYHNRASKIFFVLLQDFERNTISVDREAHEHDFQRLKRAYAQRLSKELQTIAEGILNDRRFVHAVKDFDPFLNQLAQQYIHRFVQKIDAY